ncbi:MULTISPECIES: hypothetical protein [Mesorhizobium]|uniref:Uncharacterized protein n=1 Tax=Mesorhizobium montanum TaxID=3072323 RepID=A0ABU4ZUP9_9HYPH|nr:MULTISPECIES: hypothetical protein [unclassified Mesorhizobium]MDX8449819.1 hypothetical protein [Mesorhizobium sp. VK3C]MDX8528039.1 hypothetical protein [Mesorhizobium sp. MSK_1335]
MSTDEAQDQGTTVLRFPQSRVLPSGHAEPTRYLGLGAMAKVIGAPEHQTTGHWCSRCRGIWYGYLLEATCPECGNRHG